jgi:hypothetical protein
MRVYSTRRSELVERCTSSSASIRAESFTGMQGKNISCDCLSVSDYVYSLRLYPGWWVPYCAENIKYRGPLVPTPHPRVVPQTNLSGPQDLKVRRRVSSFLPASNGYSTSLHCLCLPTPLRQVQQTRVIRLLHLLSWVRPITDSVSNHRLYLPTAWTRKDSDASYPSSSTIKNSLSSSIRLLRSERQYEGLRLMHLYPGMDLVDLRLTTMV